MGTVKASQYTTLFFDLDHTLWDYDANSKETLSDIYLRHLTDYDQFSLEIFLKNFHKINSSLWHRYNKGLIDKTYIRENRFDQILSNLNIKNLTLAGQLSEEFLFQCPRKTHLIPHTLPILEELSQKYRLYILTNGFEDVQSIKMESCNIASFFDHVITSDGCGYQKPDPAFFKHALEHSECDPAQALMIGDNLKTDILGALNTGIDTVYFNPSKNGRPHKSTFEISSLDQLLEIA